MSLENGLLKLTISAQATISTVTGGTPKTNVWSHIVATFADGKGVVYLDAAPMVPQTLTVPLVASDTSSYIGARPTGAAGFVGFIDEVALYDHALDVPRVMQHHDVAMQNP